MSSLQRFQFASRLFYIGGLFLFALSMGLGWAHAADKSSVFIGSLFASGLLGLFIGFFIQSRAIHLHTQLRDKTNSYRPISLVDSFRAFRNYREQAPLFELEDLCTQVFAIEAKKIMAVPTGARWLLVELWDGTKMNLRLGDIEKTLQNREIIVLARQSESDHQLTLEPASGIDDEYCQGIVHFIFSKSGLE